MPKPNDDHAVFFRKDGLIHLPAVVQVREHVRHLEPTGLRGSGGKSPASSSQLPHGTPKEPPTPRSLTTESPHEVSPCGAPTPQSLTTGPLPHGGSPCGAPTPRSLTTEPPAHGGSPRGAVDAPPAGPGPRLPSSDPEPATGTPLPPGQDHTPAHHSPPPPHRFQPRTHLCPHRALPLSGPSGRGALPQGVSAGQ